jgi:hypothetical protein
MAWILDNPRFTTGGWILDNPIFSGAVLSIVSVNAGADIADGSTGVLIQWSGDASATTGVTINGVSQANYQVNVGGDNTVTSFDFVWPEAAGSFYGTDLTLSVDSTYSTNVQIIPAAGRDYVTLSGYTPSSGETVISIPGAEDGDQIEYDTTDSNGNTVRVNADGSVEYVDNGSGGPVTNPGTFQARLIDPDDGTRSVFVTVSPPAGPSGDGTVTLHAVSASGSANVQRQTRIGSGTPVVNSVTVNGSSVIQAAPQVVLDNLQIISLTQSGIQFSVDTSSFSGRLSTIIDTTNRVSGPPIVTAEQIFNGENNQGNLAYEFASIDPITQTTNQFNHSVFIEPGIQYQVAVVQNSVAGTQFDQQLSNLLIFNVFIPESTDGSGSPILSPVTASGSANIQGQTQVAVGNAILSGVVALGSANVQRQTRVAVGNAILNGITANGLGENFNVIVAAGSANLNGVIASGNWVINRLIEAAGTVGLNNIIVNGQSLVSQLITALGNVTLTNVQADGLAIGTGNRPIYRIITTNNLAVNEFNIISNISAFSMEPLKIVFPVYSIDATMWQTAELLLIPKLCNPNPQVTIPSSSIFFMINEDSIEIILEEPEVDLSTLIGKYTLKLRMFDAFGNRLTLAQGQIEFFE